MNFVIAKRLRISELLDKGLSIRVLGIGELLYPQRDPQDTWLKWLQILLFL